MHIWIIDETSGATTCTQWHIHVSKISKRHHQSDWFWHYSWQNSKGSEGGKLFSVLADEVCSKNVEHLALCLRFVHLIGKIRKEFISFIKMVQVHAVDIEEAITIQLTDKDMTEHRLWVEERVVFRKEFWINNPKLFIPTAQITRLTWS